MKKLFLVAVLVSLFTAACGGSQEVQVNNQDARVPAGEVEAEQETVVTDNQDTNEESGTVEILAYYLPDGDDPTGNNLKWIEIYLVPYNTSSDFAWVSLDTVADGQCFWGRGRPVVTTDAGFVHDAYVDFYNSRDFFCGIRSASMIPPGGIVSYIGYGDEGSARGFGYAVFQVAENASPDQITLTYSYAIGYERSTEVTRTIEVLPVEQSLPPAFPRELAYVLGERFELGEVAELSLDIREGQFVLEVTNLSEGYPFDVSVESQVYAYDFMLFDQRDIWDWEMVFDNEVVGPRITKSYYTPFPWYLVTIETPIYWVGNVKVEMPDGTVEREVFMVEIPPLD